MLVGLAAALAGCSAAGAGKADEEGNGGGKEPAGRPSATYSEIDACKVLAYIQGVTERFPTGDSSDPRVDSEVERYEGSGDNTDTSTQSCGVSASVYAGGLASPDGVLDVTVTIREGGGSTFGGEVVDEHERRSCLVTFVAAGAPEGYVHCDDVDWDARITATGSGQFALDEGGVVAEESDAYVRWLADAFVDAL